MATAMTYSSLLNDLRNYLERGATLATDPSVYLQLPSLIGLAERRLARELKIQGTVTVVSSTMTQGEPTYPKPDRWRETVSIRVGTGTGYNVTQEVYPRAYEYMRQYWPNQTLTGTPRFYADYDYSHWFFAPTPNAPFPYELIYYELPPLLGDDVQTNWFTEYAPNALLYASLMEAAPFLKNEEIIPIWQGFYDRAVAALNGEDIRQIADRGIIRRED
tara:strand:+ start:2527 stop:3180 length:654 start_codon:yes stop_codon:yes gene_type:complete